MNRLTGQQDEIFANKRDEVSKAMENSFYYFLESFELLPNDPNYNEYVELLPEVEAGTPIRYYVHVAKKMRQEEKVTMLVDFEHMANFNHQDHLFMNNLVKNFYKYEQDLRQGLVKFMQTLTHNDPNIRKNYYTIAIYNLPQQTKIRELRTLNLGRLMSIYGTVTRTTDAKPELI